LIALIINAHSPRQVPFKHPLMREANLVHERKLARVGH
jgi:hypothetical protein